MMGLSYDLNHMETPILPVALAALLPQPLHATCVGARFGKHEKLFLAGHAPQWMFFVVKGEVTLERTGQHGEPVVLQRTRQGFVSEASLKTRHYHCDALAALETNVIKVPVPDLALALERDPAFAGRWIDMLNLEVKRLRLHCERLSMKSIQDKVLHLVQTEGQGGHYAVPSGLKSLAGELGVTHEALYRSLARLQKSGLLRKIEGDLVLGQDP